MSENQKSTVDDASVDPVVIPKPCPFCGGINVSTHEASTFQWWVAECNECGAMAGEVRRQTQGEGTNEEWDEAARIKALIVWNERLE